MVLEARSGYTRQPDRMTTRRRKKASTRSKRLSPETARAIALIEWLHECALGERKASDAQIDRAIRELETLVPAVSDA